MKYHPKLAWLIWGVLVLLLIIVSSCRFESLLSGGATGSDLIVFLLLVALVLAPMFSHVELFGLKFRTEVKEQFGELKNQITTLSANVQSVVTLNVTQGTSTVPTAPVTEDQSTEVVRRSAIEHKILNTLWTKQVNRYDEWLRGVVWLFRVNYPSVDFLEWRDASTRLIRQLLIVEDPQGRIFLTHGGFEYCKEHYHEFGTDQWWPAENMNPEMLERVLEEE